MKDLQFNSLEIFFFSENLCKIKVYHYTYMSAANMTQFVNVFTFLVCFDIIKRFHADESV